MTTRGLYQRKKSACNMLVLLTIHPTCTAAWRYTTCDCLPDGSVAGVSLAAARPTEDWPPVALGPFKMKACRRGSGLLSVFSYFLQLSLLPPFHASYFGPDERDAYRLVQFCSFRTSSTRAVGSGCASPTEQSCRCPLDSDCGGKAGGGGGFLCGVRR